MVPEQGPLVIFVAPLCATSGHVYLWYSITADTFMHLDRFTPAGDLANPTSTNLTFAAASRHVILGNAPDNAFNHNGGTVRFGPDGKLYLSIGDDASACTAQSTTSVAGVLMRMDVATLPAGGSTTPPAIATLDPGDNPLSNNTDISQLVIAHGLRNPFRFAIDPVTGNVYIGDVGASTQEEYSEYVYVQGALQLVNFGWPWREGTANGSGCGGVAPGNLTPPLVGIASGWSSVMGGPRYRNVNGPHDFGPAYEGNAFYADYFAGQIRRLVNNAGTWSAAAPVTGQPDPTNWGTGFTAITTTAVGPDGALYVLQHPSTYATSGGTLKRIRPLGPVPSVVIVNGSGQVGPAGEAFPQQLEVRVRDPQGQPLPNGIVNFAVSGGATLSTTNPVTADANGIARTTVTATIGGGSIGVTATTPGGEPAGVRATFFARRLSIFSASTIVLLSVSNTTTAIPASVPFIVLATAPGTPSLPTTIGPICTDPAHPLTFVVEDSTGIFGNYSLSGTGAIGTPALSKLYNFPANSLSGLQLNFQAIGIDPVAGPFRSNCEFKQF
jgi:glucose/arabinose dehydrogenase